MRIELLSDHYKVQKYIHTWTVLLGVVPVACLCLKYEFSANCVATMTGGGAGVFFGFLLDSKATDNGGEKENRETLNELSREVVVLL